MISDFFKKAGDALIKTQISSAQTKDDFMRLYAHDNAVTREILREATARGWGMKDPETFRRPYGETNTTNITVPPSQPQSSFLKNAAVAGLLGLTGGGALAGVGYYLLKDQIKPPIINPADFKAKITFDPDAAEPVKIGPLEPGK